MAKENEKENEAQEKQPRSKTRIFLLMLPVLVLLIAAAGAGFYFLGESSASGSSEDSSVEEPDQEKKEMGPLVEMDDFVVNITHKDSTRFLKLGVTLEARDKESSKEIEKRIPRIRDAVLLLVGNRKYEDIRDLQGKKQLKADLLARIREFAGEEEVSDLYLTDFVVQ